MLVAAGLMTGCGKDSEETPTKPEDPIPPVTTTYEIAKQWTWSPSPHSNK